MLEFENLAHDLIELILRLHFAVNVGRAGNDALAGEKLEFRIALKAKGANETQNRRLAHARDARRAWRSTCG